MTNLMTTPLFQMTGSEFLELCKVIRLTEIKESVEATNERRYVYGIAGIAGLLNCSIATASRYKASGVLDLAIRQIGRSVVTDAELALQLISKVNRHDRNKSDK